LLNRANVNHINMLITGENTIIIIIIRDQLL
jgi:hypothetical protein